MDPMGNNHLPMSSKKVMGQTWWYVTLGAERKFLLKNPRRNVRNRAGEAFRTVCFFFSTHVWKGPGYMINFLGVQMIHDYFFQINLIHVFQCDMIPLNFLIGKHCVPSLILFFSALIHQDFMTNWRQRRLRDGNFCMGTVVTHHLQPRLKCMWNIWYVLDGQKTPCFG